MAIWSAIKPDHWSVSLATLITFDLSSNSINDSGSLVNGNCQLTISANRITDQGFRLDGNDDQIAGDDATVDAMDGLFRKYGDHNGNAIVDLLDFAAFRAAFGN